MKKLLVCLFVGSLCYCSAHDFHVSLTEIGFDQSNERFTIASKIFVDDLEKSMGISVGEIDQSMDSTYFPGVEKYFTDHFNLQAHYLDHTKFKAEFKLLGFEIEEDVIWVYLESQSMDSQEGFMFLTIETDLLVQEFPKQYNIIHLSIGESQYSLHLHKDLKKGRITLREH